MATDYQVKIVEQLQNELGIDKVSKSQLENMSSSDIQRLTKQLVGMRNGKGDSLTHKKIQNDQNL